MGDARSLQECAWPKSTLAKASCSVSLFRCTIEYLLMDYRAQQFVAGGTSTFSSMPQQRDFEDTNEKAGPDRQIGFGQSETNGFRPSFQPASTNPEYSTFEESEAAFIKLLRRSNVQPDWTWDQTMRATIKDPQYRALKDSRDRRAAFEKYVEEVRLQEKDRAKERIAKLRTDFTTMLKRHSEIKHYTRWKTARPMIEGETTFRSTNDDNERRQLFEEYVNDLKRTSVEREAQTRKSAMDELNSILKDLDLEPYTRWSAAHEIIQSNGRFQEDEKFKTLSRSDILTAFENHIKALERTFNDQRQREKSSKSRHERQNRDQFISLLQELKTEDKIRAGIRWMDILPQVEQDERYTNLLGQPGSTPLDLFWDMLEEEERNFRLIRNDVLDALDDRAFKITLETPLDSYLNLLSSDRRTGAIPRDVLTLIFEREKEKEKRRTEGDRHAIERQQRRAIDALRSRIKHLDNPPVTTSTTFDSIRPQIAHFPEYVDLENDDLRKQAFDKVIRRLRDKEEDAEKERERHKRDHHGRDRERGDRLRDGARGERDREQRNGHRSGRHGPSRTPEREPDAYEADRRKAIADRERQYRKTSATGLSPPPPSRDRDRDRDRDRERDGHPRDRRDRGLLSPYDRERREREEERERLFRSRADPRGSRDELDYGGGGGRGARRRRERESDGESVGSGRKRRKGGRSRTPAVEVKAPVPVKEEVAVHSGSEEGEMVEEE